MVVYNQVSPLTDPLVESMEAVSDGVDNYVSETLDYFKAIMGDTYTELDLFKQFGNFNGYNGKTLRTAHDTFIRSLKSAGIWNKTYDLVLFFGHKKIKNKSLRHPLNGNMTNGTPSQGREIHTHQTPTGVTFAKSQPVFAQKVRPNGTSYSFVGGAGNITGLPSKQTEYRSNTNLPSSMTNGVCMSAYIWNQGSHDVGNGSEDGEYNFSGNFMGASNADGSKRLSFGGTSSSYLVRVGDTLVSIATSLPCLTGVALHTLNLQSDNSYKIYRNGVSQFDTNLTGNASNLPEGEQMNHFWNGTTDDPFAGMVSLTHYSEALTTQQVTALNTAVQALVSAYNV